MTQNNEPSAVEQKGSGTLGTFAGVFMPSILTILGIILFLRLGYVVGNAGLGRALLIIGAATAISTLTSLSLAAISTNMEVRGGGDYYLISRTLGIEFGGAIGIVLFLAQSVSIAFYAIGFGEAVAALAGFDGKLPTQIIAAVAVAVLFVLAWLGAEAASRFQAVVLVILVAALVSFYVGAIGSFDAGTIADRWSAPRNGLGIWVVFAVFFPAVTGFTQGVSMSGDLKDPGRSLPKGTFQAVALSTVVYVSVAILLAGTVTLSVLADDAQAMRSVSWLPVLIDAGVISATLSSAMASFLGAPRILQSLSADRVFPSLAPFAKGYGPTNNPRRGVLLSLAIAIGVIGLGSLNVIAPVVSMFFLISYGLLNYATYYEAKAGSPSFRPRFRFFHPRLSLLGGLACFGAMVAINPLAGVVALFALFAVYTYLGRRSHPERWADASHSHYFRRAKESLRLMSAEPESGRNWRPLVIAFSADPERRRRLMQLAAWLEGDSGLSAVIEILQGEGAVKRVERLERQEALKAEAEEIGVDSALVVLAHDVTEALPVIVQSFGVGPLRANTVLFGWQQQRSSVHRLDYVELLRDMVRLGANVVSVSSDAARWEELGKIRRDQRRIDVWWKDNDSGRLALLMAYLFTRSAEWSKASIRVLSTAAPDEVSNVTEALESMLDTVRISADVAVLTSATSHGFAAECGTAALVIVPARLRKGEILDPNDADLYEFFDQAPMAMAVVAGAPIDLVGGPESPDHSRRAEAEERVVTAERRLERLRQDQEKATADVEALQVRIAGGESDLEAKLVAAKEAHETVTRRTLKAQASVEQALRDLAAVVEERNSASAEAVTASTQQPDRP